MKLRQTTVALAKVVRRTSNQRNEDCGRCQVRCRARVVRVPGVAHCAIHFLNRLPARGRYMFHPHQAEFTELGWAGMFDVVDAVA